ncbi:MAG: ParA family protein [Bradymonadales bacterium]|nr:ParA family protein [Bradymonadales bacterium]
MSTQQGGCIRAKIVAIANQKGGVGKTTTAVNLAACLGQAGYRTLLVDLDPQANATSGLGAHAAMAQGTIYDGLVGRLPLDELIVPTEIEALHLVPSAPALAGAEVELVSLPDRAMRLRDLIEPMRSRYSFVFVDCPPSLNLLTLNALCAADSVMVPIQCEYYALEGLGRLLSTLEMVRDNLNAGLKVEGFVLTMFDSRNNLAHQVAREVTEHFGGLTFRSVIPRNVRLSESPSYGKPIILYDRMCKGAHCYLDLTEEFLRSNLGLLAA